MIGYTYDVHVIQLLEAIQIMLLFPKLRNANLILTQHGVHFILFGVKVCVVICIPFIYLR